MNNAHLILGTAQIEPSYGVARQERVIGASWKAILSEAGRSGFIALDTAALYPKAHAIIGKSGWDGELHTKLASLTSLEEDFEKAKLDLRRETIDLVYFHRVPMDMAEQNRTQKLASSLKDLGARFVGMSVYRPAELQAVLDIEEISHVQIPLNALDHRFLGDEISKLKSYGRTIIARSVFLQGLLASQAPLKSLTRVPEELLRHVSEFRTEAASRYLSPLQFALGFVRGIDEIDGVIVGCETVSQVKEVSAAWKNSRTLQIDQSIFSKLRVLDEDLVDPRSW